MEANAVFSGGGVKGIAFVGALKVCEEKGYRFNKVAGTSSGAIIASLIAAGYTADEILEAMKDLNYKKIVAKKGWDRIPLGRPIRLLFKKGLYPVDYLENWIDEKLAKKNIRTFEDLPPQKLQIIASNLSRGTIVQFPKDNHLFASNPQKLKISRAIRMSITIPYLFDPVRLKNKTHDVILDGGIISNFPVWLFDHDKPEEIPTFGFNLRSQNPEFHHIIHGPFSMLYALISVMIETQDQKYIEKQDAVRTIFIKTDGIKATDFLINKQQQEALYKAGIDAANKFFQTWNFSDYITRYVRRSTKSSIQIITNKRF